jgi:hypothetical protein
MNSISEVAKGIRKPSWYFSEKYIELYKNNFDKFFNNFTGKSNLILSNQEN